MQSCVCGFNVCETTATVLLMDSNRHPLEPAGGKQDENIGRGQVKDRREGSEEVEFWISRWEQSLLHPLFSSVNQTMALLGTVKKNKQRRREKRDTQSCPGYWKKVSDCRNPSSTSGEDKNEKHTYLYWSKIPVKICKIIGRNWVIWGALVSTLYFLLEFS